MRSRTTVTGLLIAFLLLLGFLAARKAVQVLRHEVPIQGPTHERSSNVTARPLFKKLNAQAVPLPIHSPTWVMVHDSATGLIWEVKTVDGSMHDREEKMNWDEAQNLLSALNAASFGGFSDWRLPSKEELLTIVDKNRTNPAVDARFFPHTAPSHYWTTSTTKKGVLPSCVNFLDGSGWKRCPKTTKRHVRAVRSTERSGGDAFDLSE
jgi:hypothetical protein